MKNFATPFMCLILLFYGQLLKFIYSHCAPCAGDRVMAENLSYLGYSMPSLCKGGSRGVSRDGRVDKNIAHPNHACG